MKFLYRDARRFWNKTLDNDYVDTLQMARMCLPRLGHHRLVDLAEYYGISSEGAHRALNDCRMNQQVFELLGRDLAKRSDPAPRSADGMRICPKCGSRNLTKIDRMNGYLSYSRVHGDTRLNSAKMAEIAERKSM